MLAAAATWDELASDLSFAAAGYGLALSELTGSVWIGPASAAMAAAVTPYVTWLISTAALAEQTASQARAAAAAYEAAFAMTVPPPVIAANRALLMSLIATNFWGQNTPAIAVAEAHYAQMWAQDAGAMYGYAGSSATAARLTVYTAPPRGPDAGGLNRRAAAVATQLISAVPHALQQLSTASTSSISSGSALGWLQNLLTELGDLSTAERTTLTRIWANGYFVLGIVQFLSRIGQQLTFGPGGTTAGSGGAWYPTPQFAGPGGGRAMSASLARAETVGSLSVPPSWAAAAPAPADRAAAVTPDSNATAARASTPGGLLRGVPLTGAGRRATGGFAHRYGFRHGVTARPPSAG